MNIFDTLRTNILNASIRDIPMPERMKRLPISTNGYPIPWFVAWLDETGTKYLPRGEGTPDFRVMGPVKEAVQKNLCWICGQTMGQFRAFVIGPMCVVNRISSEPPSHKDCAEYAVKACPFLTHPNMRRNEKDLPPTYQNTEGHIGHNPGAMAIWVTTQYNMIKANPGTLFRFGEPKEVTWWREGRTATQSEIMAAIDKGLPALITQADADGLRDQVPSLINRAMMVIPSFGVRT